MASGSQAYAPLESWGGGVIKHPSHKETSAQTEVLRPRMVQGVEFDCVSATVAVTTVSVLRLKYQS